MVCSFSVLLAASVLEFAYVSELIKKLGGPPTNEESMIYSFPWLNQYTNTIFVNFYTFLIYASIVTFCTSLYCWIKK
jgi:hypothetical protein